MISATRFDFLFFFFLWPFSRLLVRTRNSERAWNSIKIRIRVKLSPCGVGHQIRAWSKKNLYYVNKIREEESNLIRRKEVIVVMRLLSADMCGFIIICCCVSWHLSHMMESLNIIFLLRVGLKLLTKKKNSMEWAINDANKFDFHTQSYDFHRCCCSLLFSFRAESREMRLA